MLEQELDASPPLRDHAFALPREPVTWKDLVLAEATGAVAIDGAGALDVFIISLVAGAVFWPVVPRGVV